MLGASNSLREHLATYLDLTGASPTVIQSIMRHAKLQVTRDSYMDDRLMDLAVRGKSALEQRPTRGPEGVEVAAVQGTARPVDQPAGLRLAEGRWQTRNIYVSQKLCILNRSLLTYGATDASTQACDRSI
jgi:hypothetical protein